VSPCGVASTCSTRHRENHSQIAWAALWLLPTGRLWLLSQTRREQIIAPGFWTESAERTVQDTITGFLLAGVGNVDLRRKSNFLIVDQSAL